MSDDNNNIPEFDDEDRRDDGYEPDDFSDLDNYISDNFDEDAAFWQEPDFLLDDIVMSMVNLAGVEIGVTLFLKGTVMTGTLVGERTYLTALTDMFKNRVAESFPDLPQNEVEELLEAFDFSRLVEGTYPSILDKSELDPKELARNIEMSPIRYLHLKDPLIISPQPAISFLQSEVPIIRIKMTMIDGWILGRAISDDYPPNNSNHNSNGSSGDILH